jgi:hypothetical protein
MAFRLKDSIPLRHSARATCGKMTDSVGAFYHYDRIDHALTQGAKPPKARGEREAAPPPNARR